ncbi:TraB/GumN family protein [Duganella sp. LX20W]|uniref:TraB/GumN family protein n=1 Tax=Rugamonas brunnea TaxID=2758569 RepID=A0A7W2EQD1_9BURK|nr:TraB/GumN family protein [Rugamonas brunnea]MBA5636684.1 TraB/GumN family protein [Rugamonas brunnea]
MRRQIIVLFCSLFWFAVPALRAQEAVQQPVQQSARQTAPNRGALFKVAQNGHTLYLFGTIHVGAPDFYPLEERVLGALERASVLALEIDPLADPGRMAQAVQQYGMYARGAGSAQGALPAPYRPRLERLLRQYALDADTVAGMKPWLLASVLTVSEFSAQGYDTALAVDAWLARQAHQRKLPVLELESPESQMALFDRMTADEQSRFLQEGIDAIDDHQQASQAREIADAWRNADAAALDALARKAADDDTFSGRFVQRMLLDARNPALADGIAALLARETDSLAAIGVLHLVGTNSVPELLRKRGLAVERIY